MSEDVCICNLDSPSYPPTEEEMEQCPVHRKKVYPKGTIQELFDDNPKTWTKGSYGRGYNGDPAGPQGGFATSWCILGAVSKVYPEFNDHKRQEILVRLQRYAVAHGFGAITSWNDDPKRTFAEVKALVKALNI